MLVAFTRIAATNHSRPGKYLEVVRPGSRMKQIAHLPQGGTGETLCGRLVYETAEVEGESDLAACKICKSRLEAAERRETGSGFRLLPGGNNLLPAPIM